MPRFRKKPVEVEAYQFDNRITNPAPHWLSKAVDAGEVMVIYKGMEPLQLEITTLEGTMTANLGDWIIRGVQGELYPCKPDIFAATYELADPLRPQWANERFDQ